MRDESPEARDLNSKHSNESCVLKNCVNDIKYSDRGRITILYKFYRKEKWRKSETLPIHSIAGWNHRDEYHWINLFVAKLLLVRGLNSFEGKERGEGGRKRLLTGI